MRIRELLNEGPELSSSIKNVNVHIGNIIGMVYGQLEQMAHSFGTRTNATKFGKGHSYKMIGFKKLDSSVKARWFHAYGNSFKAELYSLAEQSGPRGKELMKFLFDPISGPIESKGKNFFDSGLAEILRDLGRSLDSPEMVRKAEKWIEADDKLNDLLEKLEAELEKQSGNVADEPVTSAPSKPKAPSATGQQKSQAEDIVNQVLSRLPRDIAHDIRTKISRSDNKLMALQQELTKRNIALS